MLGELVIDRIKERTDNGLDINNKPFAPYSKSYAGSKDFSIAGKTKGNVNLQLTGEMLRSLELLEHSTGSITIGYKVGTSENDKAAWAVASDNGPSRRFVGLPEKDLDLLIKQVNLQRVDEEDEVTSRLATRILARLGVGDED
jgi:hypothetical protein